MEDLFGLAAIDIDSIVGVVNPNQPCLPLLISSTLLQLKKAFITHLRRFLQEEYPGSKLKLIGSSVSGFATKSSDLGLTMVFAEGSREADTWRSGAKDDQIKARSLHQFFSSARAKPSIHPLTRSLAIFSLCRRSWKYTQS
ncbi:unnamed protein product [Rodentolepis nana]|uniref:NTP_transf_2 domain-containing protein n=1 Tax=Rodentolepis nana TaxID=102285 RepID=A0A0R3TQ28_RODNA|nr:unnamed protein product [Rodentolepis nana]